MYDFKQKVSKEDYLEFYKFHVRKNLYSPLKLVFAAVFLLTLYSGPLYGQWNMLYIGIGLTVLLGVLYLRVSTSGAKIYDQDPETFNYQYKFDNVTVSFSTKDGKSSKMWTEFVDIHETDNYVYIFMKSNKGLMFVKSQAPEGAIDFIKTKVKPKAKVKVPFKK